MNCSSIYSALVWGLWMYWVCSCGCVKLRICKTRNSLTLNHQLSKVRNGNQLWPQCNCRCFLLPLSVAVYLHDTGWVGPPSFGGAPSCSWEWKQCGGTDERGASLCFYLHANLWPVRACNSLHILLILCFCWNSVGPSLSIILKID